MDRCRMPRLFLLLAGLLLLAFAFLRDPSPPTREPFVAACMSGGHALQRQCECLSDYVHEQLSPAEIRAIMDNQVVDASFQARVALIIRTGSRQCR